MRTYKIKEITNKIFSGGTPSTQKPEFWNGNLPWLSSGETRNQYISFTEKTITKLGSINSSTRLARKGAVVIASAGQGYTRGQTSYLLIDSYINQSIVALESNESICLSKYLFYNLSTRYDEMRLLSDSSSTRGSITTKMIADMSITLPSIEEQHHIVNTIGSVDELIENLEAQIIRLNELGLLKINDLNDNTELKELSSIATLVKGFEIGSANYFEGQKKDSIHYIRVGDLNSLSNTFVYKSEDLKIAEENDVLIAFDGAPGRIAVGISGAFSSGIYKVHCNENLKGLCYFELNSKTNQKTISDYSQGTTILHASKSIEHLKTIDPSYAQSFGDIFKQIVSLKKKINVLKEQKCLLLAKYFTN